MEKIYDNGTMRDMTADEQAQLEKDRANTEAEAKAVQEEKEAKDNLKSSAKAKLIAGEPLTEAEADTLII